MAALIESFTNIVEGAEVGTFTAVKPTGLLEGEHLVAIVAKDDDVLIDTPVGWSSELSIAGVDHSFSVLLRLVDAADAAATDFTFTGDSEEYVGRLYRISGLDATTQIDVADTVGNTDTSTAPIANSITTVTDGALVFAVAGMDDDDTPYSLDTAGWTEDLNSVSGTSAGSCGIVIGRKVQTTAGATGNVAFTTNASDGWTASQFALRPAAATSSQTIGTTQVTEVEEAQPILAALGAVTGTTAQIIESEIPQTITPTPGALAQSLTQAVETEVVQGSTSLHGVGGLGVWGALGYWAEATGSLSISTLQVTEVEIAQAIAPLVGVVTQTTDQIVEVETGQSTIPVPGALAGVLIPAIEVETSQVVSAAGSITQSTIQVTEAETAQTITSAPGAITQSLTQVIESEIVQEVTPVSELSLSFNQVIESEESQTFTATSGVLTEPFNQITESEVAQPLAVSPGTLTHPVTQIIETETPQSFTMSQGTSKALNQVIETETSPSGNSLHGVGGLGVWGALGYWAESVSEQTVVLNQVIDSETVQSLSPLQDITQVVEIETAQAFTAYPGVNQFVKTFSVNYAELPADSFAYGITDLSTIVAGDAYIMDDTASDGASVSGDDLGIIAVVGGTPYAVRTINYSIHDVSDGTVGLAGTITILPITSQVIEIEIAQPVSITQGVGGQTGLTTQVTEIENSQPVTLLSGQVTEVTSTVVETEEVRPLSSAVGVTLSQVIESDIILPTTPNVGSITVGIAQIVETEIPQAISTQTALTIPLNQVVEIEILSPLSLVVSSELAQVLESEIVLSVISNVDPVSVGITQVVEIETVLAFTPITAVMSYGGVFNARGRFNPGSTVTIELFDPITDDIIGITDNLCAQKGVSNRYIWDTSKLTVQPTSYQEYDFDMTDGLGNYSHGVIQMYDLTVSDMIKDIHGQLQRSVFINTELTAPDNNGYQQTPYDNWSDGVDYAEANGIKKLIPMADADVDRQLKNFTIEGIGLPKIDLSGHIMDKSMFILCELTGSYSGVINAMNCALNNLSGLNGVFFTVNVTGTITVGSSGNVTLWGVTPAIAGQGWTLNMNTGSASIAAVHESSGEVTILNMDDAGDLLHYHSSNGEIIISESCIAGEIYIHGDVGIIDNSGPECIVDISKTTAKLSRSVLLSTESFP